MISAEQWVLVGWRSLRWKQAGSNANQEHGSKNFQHVLDHVVVLSPWQKSFISCFNVFSVN